MDPFQLTGWKDLSKINQETGKPQNYLTRTAAHQRASHMASRQFQNTEILAQF
jgi:hypothetical protein